jgi:multicomponent K+:H+ antiporter subunit A
MRAPVELLVLTCLVVGIFPAQSVGPLLAAAALPVVGGTLPEYSLAIWHGWNAPLIMSLIAMSGGIVLYLLLRKQLQRGRFANPPLIGASTASACSSRPGAPDAAGPAHRATAHHPPPADAAVHAGAGRLLAGLMPMLHSGLSWGDRPKIPAPGVRRLWLIAIACAIGAAWQAKYHRLAALIMVSVCGLMTCITFVWFSAPDLALTQLVVEVVTTVLILLGLRWLPRRIEGVSPLPAAWTARAPPARPAAGGAGRRRHGAAVLRHADPPHAQRHLLVLPQPALPKAVAPTWST